ncbi:MAG: hypothetical protein J6N71_09710 [Muribaculaceae bacterium]|nr:hypothetical protein [Muribaculaceae bacterium]
MDIKFIQSRIAKLSQEDLVNKFFGKDSTHFVENFQRLKAIVNDPAQEDESKKLNEELSALIGISVESLNELAILNDEIKK